MIITTFDFLIGLITLGIAFGFLKYDFEEGASFVFGFIGGVLIFLVMSIILGVTIQ